MYALTASTIPQFVDRTTILKRAPGKNTRTVADTVNCWWWHSTKPVELAFCSASNLVHVRTEYPFCMRSLSVNNTDNSNKLQTNLKFKLSQQHDIWAVTVRYRDCGSPIKTLWTHSNDILVALDVKANDLKIITSLDTIFVINTKAGRCQKGSSLGRLNNPRVNSSLSHVFFSNGIWAAVLSLTRRLGFCIRFDDRDGAQ